jgi:integrase
VTDHVLVESAAATPRSTRRKHTLRRHDDLIDAPHGVGPHDDATIEEVLALLPALPVWPVRPDQYGARSRRLAGTRAVLEWIQKHPGAGWQQRWKNSGADAGMQWIDDWVFTATGSHDRHHSYLRGELVAGIGSLLLCRIVLPSYDFLAAYRAHSLFKHVQQVFRPDLFATIDAGLDRLNLHGRRRLEPLSVLGKLVLHTGRDLDRLVADDLLAYRAWECRQYRIPKTGISVAWVLVREVTDLGEHAQLRDAVRYGQRPTAELVDAYRLRCRPVRDMLVRYFDERRPSLDYSSLRGVMAHVIGNFWADIEQHHPEVDTLRLPEPVVEAWKQRLKVVVLRDGSTRPRQDYFNIQITVRSFYLDIQEWAHHDSYWAIWAAPSPIRRRDAAGQSKVRQKKVAKVHQRIRERLPHLPQLVDAAEKHFADQASMLAAASAVTADAVFRHDGREFRRIVPQAYRTGRDQGLEAPAVRAVALNSGEKLNLTRAEDEAFWAWAAVETLRHTGIRVEELSELTQLAVISYRLPGTGEVVPMLQIVPSKTNEERLLLISPELASVLASIITRLRRLNGGTVPLTARYDPHERVLGDPLPLLFQHRQSWRWTAINDSTIRKLLNRTLVRAGVHDEAGQPLHYTPHDFRRMFATEAVNGGLPLHIVARLLGHGDLNVTQAYTAVFDEELVRSYQTFLARRRAARPAAEHRLATDDEWREFQQHFQTRQLELGTCGRPYGTPCRHEHACIRCPSMRLDPRARPRLVSIIRNLGDRINEARDHGWLGEVDGLQTSLAAATEKLTNLDRINTRAAPGRTDLGMPTLPTVGGR